MADTKAPSAISGSTTKDSSFANSWGVGMIFPSLKI